MLQLPMDEMDDWVIQTSMPMLNNDAVANIIKQLQGDRRALKACALVCQAWLHPARQNFFHTVVLDSLARAERLRALLYESPLLAVYVKTLHFNTYNHYMQKNQVQDLQSWVTRAFPVLAQALPFIDTLHFDYIQWDSLQGLDQNFLMALSDLHTVKDIQFRSSNFATFASFERIVRSFSPNTRRLTLDGLVWHRPHPLREAYRLSLDTLSVSGYHMELIGSWLAKVQVGTSNSDLTSLEFNQLHDEGDLMYVGKILHDMGSHLEKLKIGCYFSCEGYTRLQDMSQWLPLQHNTRLRHLHVRVIDLTPEYMQWILSLLRLVSKHKLLTLVFDVWLSLPKISKEPWGEIAWLISESPQFASLQQVKFLQHGPLDMESAAACIQQRFPILSASRKLVIENRHLPENYN